MQTVRDRVDKRIGEVEESFNAITTRLESLEGQLAEHDKNTQDRRGSCDADAKGFRRSWHCRAVLRKRQMQPQHESSRLRGRRNDCHGRTQRSLFIL